MLRQYILPALSPYPDTEEGRTLFFRRNIQKTGREWYAHLDAQDLADEMKLDDTKLDESYMFEGWLLIHQKLTNEIPIEIIDGARKMNFPPLEAPPKPRDDTNDFLMRSFKITIPGDVVVDLYAEAEDVEQGKLFKKHVKSLVGGAIMRVPKEDREKLLQELKVVMEREIGLTPRYKMQLARYNYLMCSRNVVEAERKRCQDLIDKRNHWIDRLQEVSIAWYAEGIAEFKQSIAEKNRKRSVSDPPISAYRKDGRFDLGERFYRHPGSDPCAYISDDY